MEGPAALLLLGGLVATAGLCVAVWGFAERPAECALAAGIAAVSCAVLPVHVLGWAGWLTRGSIALGTCALAIPIVGATLSTARGRRRLREGVIGLGRLVREGVLCPWRERSLTLVGLAAVLLITGWTAWLSYLAPSSGWDGVMYHEPMVGFALQNRGFEWVGLEGVDPMLGPVDGYPRLVENLMLFLVALWDRRLIDLVPSLLAPILLVATYVLLRRFVASRVIALGLACGFVLIPGVLLQLRSTYVDIGFVTFTAASAAFLVRRTPRAPDLWMAGLSLGLLGGSKVTGILVVPAIGFFGVVLVAHASLRARSARLLPHLLGGFALVLALMGPTYARNWTRTQNLTWPSSVQMESLGIDWQGPLAISDMNVPREQAIGWLFGPPIPGQQYHDTKDNGYGNVPPFLVLPLALAGLFSLLWHGLLSLPRLRGRVGVGVCRGRRRRDALMLLGLTLPILCTFALTPARHWARLNLHVVLALWVLAAWWLGGKGRRLIAEGVVGALIIGGLVTLHWSEPAWDVDRARARRLYAMEADERAAQRDRVFTLMPTETAMARERELGEGDLLLFSGHPFVGLLWNERFSNRVEHLDPAVHRGANWLDEAEARRATWVVVEHRSSLLRLLRASATWEEVGAAEGGDAPAFAFRRSDSASSTPSATAELPAAVAP